MIGQSTAYPFGKLALAANYWCCFRLEKSTNLSVKLDMRIRKF